MFLVILLYVLISFLSYITSHKTEVYEVRSGSLSDNMVYQGIAIRRETVVNSDYTGTINYYNKEGERIQTGGLAFSVDESGKITDYLQQDDPSFFSAEDISLFRDEAISFSRKFSHKNFANVYDFKSSAVSSAQKISNRKVLSEIPDLSSTSIHPCYASSTGEIIYAVDNCEQITFENLTVEDFNRTGYKKNLDGLEWQARAKGFIWGADVAEDYGWRFIQIGNGVVVTDEEALDEYSMRQFEASGGDLLGRISNALGIDLGEIATALEEAAGEEAEEVEEIEDVEAGESKPQGESQ
jgi:hypothetical protein